MRALVTGAKGFVGTWLVSHLQESGDEVVAIDREVDVADADAVRRAVADAEPDAVYHLAAKSHVGRSWDDPQEVLRINTLGTLNVLEAVRHLPNAARLLFVSSAEVYGILDESDLPATEYTRLAPATPYAASKVAAEYLAVQAHLAYGTRVVMARPFNHIGPGQGEGFVVPSLAERIVDARRKGSGSVPVGNLSARRDLTDVRDVVRAYRLLVERGADGQIYNVCSGHAVAISELADRLVRLAGVEVDLFTDPELKRPVDVPVLCGDCAKLHAATGWAPAIELDRTLADVLEEWDRRLP